MDGVEDLLAFFSRGLCSVTMSSISAGPPSDADLMMTFGGVAIYSAQETLPT